MACPFLLLSDVHHLDDLWGLSVAVLCPRLLGLTFPSPQLDGLIHRFITLLADTSDSRSSESRVADANMACRKLAVAHPVLLLRYWPARPGHLLSQGRYPSAALPSPLLSRVGPRWMCKVLPTADVELKGPVAESWCPADQAPASVVAQEPWRNQLTLEARPKHSTCGWQSVACEREGRAGSSS
jgi:hypothetical protein